MEAIGFAIGVGMFMSVADKNYKAVAFCTVAMIAYFIAAFTLL